MKTRIAICQLNPRASKPGDNFRTIEQTIKNYSGRKVKLFIFPEDFLNGILRSGEDILAAGKKFEFWIERFRKLARKYKVDLIPGSFPLFKEGKLFNATIYIDSLGEVLNQYSKTNLWLSERDGYSINTNPPECFQSILGKTMQIICWDLMDRKLFEKAVKQNVKWIINISLWSTNQSRDLERKRGKTKNKYHISIRRSERLNSIVETRSSEYNIGMIFCNIGGIHIEENRY
ncbi:MAG: Nitrilase/cyanide hydratase and apolipoprotein N-acyltransferase [Microgenomates group bacterium GW2011_GWA2_37_6]|nr:MAG: Nitrilase/cyanide hydratase and apolipoprotein N-acyltransferase [Microgenomates group bacterium GW2011_GWA2_37_6]